MITKLRSPKPETISWPVQSRPSRQAVEDGWRVDLATDERGETAAVILYLKNKFVVELLKWDDLRINGVKMDLPFENSEMLAEVFCGMIQISTNAGLVVTLDDNGKVEDSLEIFIKLI